MDFKKLVDWYYSIWEIDMDIKEMVGGEKKVKFLHYRKGELWYEAENGLRFPVPISDTGDATFLPEDKAILFMRYINKQLKLMKEEEKKPAYLPTGAK